MWPAKLVCGCVCVCVFVGVCCVRVVCYVCCVCVVCVCARHVHACVHACVHHHFVCVAEVPDSCVQCTVHVVRWCDNL